MYIKYIIYCYMMRLGPNSCGQINCQKLNYAKLEHDLLSQC